MEHITLMERKLQLAKTNFSYQNMGEWNWVRIWSGMVTSWVKGSEKLVPWCLSLLASPAILYHQSLGEFCGRPHSIHKYTKIPILIIKHHPKTPSNKHILKNAIKHLARMGSDACNMHRKDHHQSPEDITIFCPHGPTMSHLGCHSMGCVSASPAILNDEPGISKWNVVTQTTWNMQESMCLNGFYTSKNMSLIKEWRCWELHLRWRDAFIMHCRICAGKVVPKSCWSLPFNHQAMGQNGYPIRWLIPNMYPLVNIQIAIEMAQSK